jgi:curved DNA-binding protein CbpA
MMKSLAEMDHYEVLEVPRDARPNEIERAFALVRTAYEGDALAAYSVITPDEAKLWRERIDEAYRVLSDPVLRRAYDEALDAAQAAPRDDEGDPFAGAAGAEETAAPLAGFTERGAPLRAELPPAPDAPLVSLAAAHAASPLRVEEPPHRDDALPRDLEAFEEDEEAGAEWTGARLRRARLLRGLEIDDVSRATKINPTYLRFIEEERFDGLPAVVYVRGFVTAYARVLGIDPARVAPSYVARCEEQRRGRPRGRFLGRPHAPVR